MKRKDFVHFVQEHKSKNKKKPLISGASITDPTFARTGRQMIFNPLNIEYRMKYPAGNPLDKENPMEFKEFDKLYPDIFKAMRQAKEHITTTKTKLNELQDKYNQQQQQQNQQPK